MVQISKGQFLCHSDGSVAVKFDNGKIQTFACSKPPDGTTGLLFIHPADRFLAELKTSKKVMIEAPFFQEATRQIPFDISGLAWK